MSTSPEMINKAEIDRVADEHGCAVSVVDRQHHEIYTSNNNSICRELNPGPGFSFDCDRYCGEAVDHAISSGEVVPFRCHAGLDCRASVYRSGDQPLVAIIGRTFVDAEKYRQATERAITGDWSGYPPNDFFDNVLMSGSARHLDQAADALQKLTAKDRLRTAQEAPDPARPEANPLDLGIQDKLPVSDAMAPTAEPLSERGGSSVSPPGVSRHRSFVGSLLDLDYTQAAEATLNFLGQEFGFTSMLWLMRSDDRLENSAGFGKLKNRNVKVGIGATDERMLRALKEGTPLQVSERRRPQGAQAARKMTLFPIGFAGSISAAIAVLDPIDNETEEQIVRICRSIAQQIEILRLRREVERGDQFTSAIRRFTEGLKRTENEDFWMSLTQKAAEMLKAERSSLLVFNKDSQRFEIKAILGARDTFVDDPTIGDRVARYVFETGRAIAIEDIEKAGVLAKATDRSYKTPSFLSSPISVGGRVIGVMNFADRACGKSFDKAALELFDAIAPQLAMAMDRAELKERAGQFEQLSVTDALTGLLNRRYMEERLMEETKRSNRHGYPMSFMMLDVDEFKSYNDRYGHPAGDEALKIVAKVMRDTLRSADVAARFGGEEFAILLPQTTNDEARIIADRIRVNIEQTKFPHRPVTISIGVSSCSAELCRDADLVSAADKALYKAKRSGRNRVLAFEDELGKVSARE